MKIRFLPTLFSRPFTALSLPSHRYEPATPQQTLYAPRCIGDSHVFAFACNGFAHSGCMVAKPHATPHLRFEPAIAHSPQTRLIRLDEINEDGHQAYRQALANVYATLDPEQNVRFLYLFKHTLMR